jgi:hypothetical protein
MREVLMEGGFGLRCSLPRQTSNRHSLCRREGGNSEESAFGPNMVCWLTYRGIAHDATKRPRQLSLIGSDGGRMSQTCSPGLGERPLGSGGDLAAKSFPLIVLTKAYEASIKSGKRWRDLSPPGSFHTDGTNSGNSGTMFLPPVNLMDA